MAIRKRITWSDGSSLSDPRLKDFDQLVKSFFQNTFDSSRWRSAVFENREGELPPRGRGYYREFKPAVAPGLLRVVIGRDREVYLTGDHYGDYGVGFRQVIGLSS